MARTEVIVKFIARAVAGLALPLTTMVATWASAAHAQERPFLRPYDVGALVFKETQFFPPSFGLATPGDGNGGSDPVVGIELADLVSLLKEATDPKYWEAEEVALRPEDSGWLSVVCHEAMHERLAATLELMHGWFHEQIVIEVHLLSGSVIRDSKAILSAEAVDTLLRNVAPHELLVERALLGGDVVMSSSQARSQVGGLEAKAVQNATSRRPVVEDLLVGCAWRVSTRRAGDQGIVVRIDGSHAKHIGNRPARMSAGGKESGSATQFELPMYRSGGASVAALLQDGEGLLFGADSEDSVVCCLRIRRIQPAPHEFTVGFPADAPSGQLFLRAYPVAHLTMGVSPQGYLRMWPRSPHEPESDVYHYSEEEWAPPVMDESRLVDTLKSTISPDKWDGSPFTLNPMHGVFFVRADQATHVAVARQLELFGRDLRRRYNVEVRHGRFDLKSLPANAIGNAEALAGDGRMQTCLGVADRVRGQ